MRLKLANREIEERVTMLALGVSTLALGLTPICLLFWLMQPKVLANPGILALRVAGAASYEPFLHAAEPSHLIGMPRHESPARLAQGGLQYRKAMTSAQRKAERVPSRPTQTRKTTKPTAGLAQYSDTHGLWNLRGQARSYESPAPAARRHQMRLDYFVVAQSRQDDFNARREEIAR
jgi:hypothetical protein